MRNARRSTLADGAGQWRKKAGEWKKECSYYANIVHSVVDDLFYSPSAYERIIVRINLIPLLSLSFSLLKTDGRSAPTNVMFSREGALQKKLGGGKKETSTEATSEKSWEKARKKNAFATTTTTTTTTISGRV